MDKATLLKMRNGDHESFRLVIMESQRPLFSFILKFMADESAAQDLLQETYFRIWKNRSKYNPDRNFMTWALTIAVNLCKDYRRRNIVIPRSTDDDGILAQRVFSDTDICRELSNREWAAVVRSLASEIGGKQRVVFTLSCLEGYSHDEIRTITGLNLTQIKSNLYAAKQTIKQRLKEMGYE